MNPTTSSISLDYEQVRTIIQDWLNANLLRTPHRVTDLDMVHSDPDVVFNITLVFNGTATQPAAAQPAPRTPEALPAAKPAASPKSRTIIPRETRQRCLELIAAGVQRNDIADQLGIGRSTVYTIQREARQEAAHGALA